MGSMPPDEMLVAAAQPILGQILTVGAAGSAMRNSHGRQMIFWIGWLVGLFKLNESVGHFR